MITTELKVFMDCGSELLPSVKITQKNVPECLDPSCNVDTYKGQINEFDDDPEIKEIYESLGLACTVSSEYSPEYVQVFSRKDAGSREWSQLGSDIEGDLSGALVSISSDGKTVSVGANRIIDDRQRSGVRVYEAEDVDGGTGWMQVGPALDDEAEWDISGSSISISSDGQTVAICALALNTEDGASRHARVYTLMRNESTWLSSEVIHEDAGGENECSLSGDGKTLAVRATRDDTNSQEVKVFVRDDHGTTGTWQRRGQPFISEAEGDCHPCSISLSYDGQTIAIGTPGKLTSKSDSVKRILQGSAVALVKDQRVHSSTADVFTRRLRDQPKRERSLQGQACNQHILSASFCLSAGYLSGASLGVGDPCMNICVASFAEDLDCPSLQNCASQHCPSSCIDELDTWLSCLLQESGFECPLSGGYGSTSAPSSVYQPASLPPSNDAASTLVRVYRIIESDWNQVGEDITCKADDCIVSLSSSGTMVTVVSPWKDADGGVPWHVRVFGIEDTEKYPSSAPSLKPSATFRPSLEPSSYPTISPTSYWATLSWTQDGIAIVGDASSDESGKSVAISGDRTTLAIGSPGKLRNADRAGHVNVYYKTFSESSNWHWELGETFEGAALGDGFGWSLSLSDNGRTIAIGASSWSKDRPGYTRVYSRSSDEFATSWTQLGEDIVGEALGELSGTSVSLSADGKTVATLFSGGKSIGVGAPEKGGSGGHVRVDLYDEITATWTQVGQKIDAGNEYDAAGRSMSLSADGKAVAIGIAYDDGGKDTFALGAYWNDEDGNDEYSGHVRIYQLVGDDTQQFKWEQLGQDLDGEDKNDQFGYSVSLSGETEAGGKAVAVGAVYNDGNGEDSGHVRVFEFDAVDSRWRQLGQTLTGDATGDKFGISVSLSTDGKTLAIGANGNDANGDASGHVRVYRSVLSMGSSIRWVQIGSDIVGDSEYDNSGHSVAISTDGKTVAIGSPGSDSNGNDSGQVRVFQTNDPPMFTSSTPDNSSQPTQSLALSPGSSTSSSQLMLGIEALPRVCQTEQECGRRREVMGLSGFYPGEHKDFGCFSQNGALFWGVGGTTEQNGLPLKGKKERVWC